MLTEGKSLLVSNELSNPTYYYTIADGRRIPPRMLKV